MAKVLLIDDDQNLTDSLISFLQLQGFLAEAADSAETAKQLLLTSSFDVIILDWNLPGMKGDAFCRQFRDDGGQTPIIFLTGRNDISFLERGFDVGADDYLSKPFESRELVARVKGLLKRRANPFSNNLTVGTLILKPDQNIISNGEKEVKLRPKEAALLEFLIRNPNKLFTAQQLMNSVWKSDTESNAHSVRTWIGLLRQKLAEVGHEDLIRTEPGAGYSLQHRD